MHHFGLNGIIAELLRESKPPSYDHPVTSSRHLRNLPLSPEICGTIREKNNV